MATGQPIILGGGIGKGTPFTLGSLLRIVNVTPPTAADSIAFQRTQTAVEVITIGLNSFPAATEKLQVIGGLISDNGPNDNVVIGRGVIAPNSPNSRNVVIGTLGVVPAAGLGTENVLIGYNNSLQSGIGSSVMIGAGNAQGPNTPVPLLIVGQNNTINNAFTGPGIGQGSSWQGTGVGIGNQQSSAAVNSWVMIGRAARANADSVTAVGDTAHADHTAAIALGRASQTLQANQFVMGAAGLGITNVLVGEGDTIAAPAEVVYRSTNASGADAAGGIRTLQASLGTGNSLLQGSIRFRTGTPAGSSAVLQVAATRLEILPAQNANGAAVNFVATNSPGAAAGTLLNAPTAGNPNWIPVLFNGAVRFIPAWP